MLTAVAASVLLINWIATPSALMRLYDRFYAQILYQKTSAALALISFTVLWLTGSNDVLPYVIAVTLSSIAGKLLYIGMAVQEAKKRGLWRRDLLNLDDLFSRTPQLWRYVLTTNVDGVVRVVREVDIFIVNTMLGTAAAGLYRVARLLGRAFSQVATPFYLAIYPELASMISTGKLKEFTRLICQSSLTVGLILGLAWLGFVVVGPYLLPLVFGADYAAAYGVTVACLAAMVVWAFSQPLPPGMMALGKVGMALTIHATATAAYIGLLVIGILLFGIIGAGIALLLFYVIWSLGTFFALRHYIAMRALPIRPQE
jgi:O-antigen/teichoic acid export membrane protein